MAGLATKLEQLPIEQLIPYASNPREHSPKQIRKLADAITRFGFLVPILIAADGTMLAGHGRLAAARLLKLASVPVIRIDNMSAADKQAFRIADNRLAELSGWSKKQLASELALIIEMDADFDIEVTGFDMSTVELLLDQDDAARVKEDAPPAPREIAVSRRGDLWSLGRHLLLCGDATERASYAALMGRSRAQVVFADPPYNVPIDGHVSGLGRIRHREFEQAAGELEPAEFIAFLSAYMAESARVSVDGSIHFACMDWRHDFELETAGRAVFGPRINLCVWAKDNGGMGSLYRSQHELIAVFKHGERPHINAVELGRHGRNRTNVWSYPGASSFSVDRAQHLAWHPTVKPQAMVADAILDVSRRDGIVLDPFGGSGTTLLASEQTNRRARLIEIDPLYCDVIVRRFQTATGVPATDASGAAFDEREKLATAASEEARHG